MPIASTRAPALLLLSLGCGVACRQVPPEDRVGPLLAAIDDRLELGEEVARSKWNSKAPIEDLAREAQVVSAAVDRASAFGLDPAAVEAFLRAQIEASKRLQRERHEAWNAEGRGPFETTADVGRDLRPALDRLTTTLLERLAAAAPVLAEEGGREALLARAASDAPVDGARRRAREIALGPLVEPGSR